MQPPQPPPSAPLYPEITGCVAALGDCVVLQQQHVQGYFVTSFCLSATQTVLWVMKEMEILLKCRPKLFLFFYNVFECCHLLAAPACDSELFRNRPTLQLSLATAV